MDVDEIIGKLRDKGFIEKEKVPDAHHVHRRELEHKDKHRRQISIESIVYADLDGKFNRPELKEWVDNIKKGKLISKGATEEKDGIDLLAWYQPFHWSSSNSWGIYILDGGVRYLSENVFEHSDDIMPRKDLIRGFKLLFLHEFFHFNVEIQASIQELETSNSIYTSYTKNVYLKPDTNKEYEPLEEALADAFAFRAISQRPEHSIKSLVLDKVFNNMKNQPNGYRAFEDYLEEESFRDGLTRITVDWGRLPQTLNERSNDFCKGVGWNQFGDVPVYLVETWR